jgi:hypothetical protein
MLKLIPFALLIASTAQASVIMTMRQEFYSQDKKVCNMVVAIDPARGRVDTDCGPQKVSIITIRESKKMIMLNEGNKTYFEMDEATIEKMQTDPMEALKSDPRFSAQLAKMTPEQKAMMAKMMAGAVKKATDVKAELKKIGKVKKIGSWSCTTYGVYVNGKLTEDLCLADNSQFPDLKPVIAAWKDFSQGWLKLSRSPTVKAHEEAMKIGIAVETLLYDGGGLKSKMDLTEIKNEPRPEAFFKAPAEYKKASSILGQ